MNALIVDDDPQVVKLTERWLTQAGYSVATSSGMMDAIEHVEQDRLDALVVDIRLGEFNGLQIAFKAREHLPHARIVVMSAWNDPVLRRDAAHCGAAYIVKPFSSSELLTAIRQEETLAQPA